MKLNKTQLEMLKHIFGYQVGDFTSIPCGMFVHKGNRRQMELVEQLISNGVVIANNTIANSLIVERRVK